MDQASASPAASCARNPAAPRTSSSCSRSADQSQTDEPPPARSAPQSEPHAEPSNRLPRPSSPALCRSRQRLSAAGFLLRRNRYPAASVRDYCSGAYTKAALAAKRASGASRGNPKNLAAAGSIGRAVQISGADAFAAALSPSCGRCKTRVPTRWKQSPAASTNGECALPEARAGTSHRWPIYFPERRASQELAKLP